VRFVSPATSSTVALTVSDSSAVGAAAPTAPPTVATTCPAAASTVTDAGEVALKRTAAVNCSHDYNVSNDLRCKSANEVAQLRPVGEIAFQVWKKHFPCVLRGSFVDTALRHSNSHFFERHFDWSGVLVEKRYERYATQLKWNRPSAVVVNCARDAATCDLMSLVRENMILLTSI
jgi:hypothetical protein